MELQQETSSIPDPRGMGHPVTHPAPRVRNCPHLLGHHALKTSKKTKPPQMASADLMEVAWSPPLTWEDWVWEEEEEQEGCFPAERDSQQCPSSPWLEGCNVSDISMVDESLWQRDSDVVVEEDENMEMDEPADSGSPTVLPEKGFLEGPEAEADEDQHSHTTEESTDQNLPHDSDLNEDELLGPPADVSVPRGHSDDSVALRCLPG